MTTHKAIAAIFLALSLIIAVLGLIGGEIVVVFVAAISADAAIAMLLSKPRRS